MTALIVMTCCFAAVGLYWIVSFIKGKHIDPPENFKGIDKED